MEELENIIKKQSLQEWIFWIDLLSLVVYTILRGHK